MEEIFVEQVDTPGFDLQCIEDDCEAGTINHAEHCFMMGYMSD